MPMAMTMIHLVTESRDTGLRMMTSIDLLTRVDFMKVDVDPSVVVCCIPISFVGLNQLSLPFNPSHTLKREYSYLTRTSSYIYHPRLN